jgi:hypothetical protein
MNMRIVVPLDGSPQAGPRLAPAIELRRQWALVLSAGLRPGGQPEDELLHQGPWERDS